MELLYSNVYNKSAKVTVRMDGARVEVREQESCFCRTQVPLVFGIAHGYSLTSFALDLYPSEQFNSEQMCAGISVISRLQDVNIASYTGLLEFNGQN